MKARFRCAAAVAATVVGLCATTRAGIVHEWKLNEASGSSALDSIGGASAPLSGASSWTSGVLGNSFKTTGGNLGFVNAGNVGVAGTFSLSFWVKPEDVTQDWRNMVSKHDGANGTKSIFIGQGQADGSLRFSLYFDGTNPISLDTSAGVLSSGSWSFVTATWNEATKLQSIYIDGVLCGSATRTGSTFLTPRSSNLLFSTNSTMATQGAGTGSWARFSGSIDDVAMWNDVLGAGEVKAMYNTLTTPGLTNFDAQTYAAVQSAYQTNFDAQVGNVRWSRATGLGIGEGIVQQRPNGFVMQLDAAGVGVTALSTVGISYDPQHTNLADTTTASENPGGNGLDLPSVHIFGNGTSEIDGLTSNSSIGSADIRPDGAVSGTVLVMLWLKDTQGADDRAVLRSEMAGAGGSIYSVLDASSADWVRLASDYAGFDTLLRFDNATQVGAFNWDFATHTDIVVDQLAVTGVPEPTSLSLLMIGASMLGRRRRQ